MPKTGEPLYRRTTIRLEGGDVLVLEHRGELDEAALAELAESGRRLRETIIRHNAWSRLAQLGPSTNIEDGA